MVERHSMTMGLRRRRDVKSASVLKPHVAWAALAHINPPKPEMFLPVITAASSTNADTFSRLHVGKKNQPSTTHIATDFRKSQHRG